MNHHHSILSTLLVSTLALGGLAANETNSTAEAHAESTAEATGNETSTHKKTVTVTSDGKRTIRKTVIVRDGIEETTTEITDEDGNTTTTKGDRGDAPVSQPHGPWLGVRVKELSEALRPQLGLPSGQGVLVDLVAPKSPAAKAGIEKGDLLLTLAGESLGTPEDLATEIRRHEAGATVPATIMRRGQRQTVEVTLEQRPENAIQHGPPPEVENPDHKPGGDQKVEIQVDGGGFDAILDDPNVPEDFKKTVREMQQKMQEFEQKHMGK